jgi:putative FmdB family regulatory protein
MPLFEYACRGCGHRFETLVLSSSRTVACPKCASEEVDKQFSTFGTGSSGRSGSSFNFPSGGG